MTNFKDKKVAVLGLAKSGSAAAARLAKLGAKVFATDVLPKEKLDPKIIDELEDLKVVLELGGHNEDSLLSSELMVLSPGVPFDLPILNAAREKKIPVISEIELAYRFLIKPIYGNK